LNEFDLYVSNIDQETQQFIWLLYLSA